MTGGSTVFGRRNETDGHGPVDLPIGGVKTGRFELWPFDRPLNEKTTIIVMV